MSHKITEYKDIKDQRGYLRYNRDVVHTHSPAAGRLINLVLGHFEHAFEEGRKGKQVIWNNARCVPLVYACDTIPLTIPDLARFGHSENIPKAEDYFHIPAETCAMVKAELGGFYEFMDSPCKRIVSTGLRCEPELVSIFLMDDYGYESYILDVIKKPNNPSEQRQKELEELYKKEYIKFAHWLNNKEIDKEKLHAELVRSNRIRRKLLKLEALEKEHNTYFRTVPTMLARCGVETYFGQPEEFESIIEAMIEELQTLPEGAYHDESLVKLVWSGARGVDFSVYNAVDMTGGYISGWNLPNTIDMFYDEDIDPIDACVKFDLQDKFFSDLEEACEKDEKLIQDSGAKGIILYSTLGCTFVTMKTEMKRTYLNQKNIPVLVMTGTSQIGETNGQTLTRLKAFTEMLS